MIAAIAFYLFAAILLVSAAMVVSSRNPVHSVLFLILAFFNAAGLFLLAGAEFLAMILVIVYVGAVAVLFLFVVMMLDVNFAALREGFQRYAPIGATIGVVLFGELVLVITGWKIAPPTSPPCACRRRRAALQNTAALGNLIYTDYILLFQTAGLILLVAMIGAIVLTLRDKSTTSRRQNIDQQTARTVADTLVVMPVALGAGIKTLGIMRPKPPEPARIPVHHGTAHDETGHH